MNFEVFELMYAWFTEFIYKVLEIFGIKVNDEGDLEEAE